MTPEHEKFLNLLTARCYRLHAAYHLDGAIACEWPYMLEKQYVDHILNSAVHYERLAWLIEQQQIKIEG